MSEVCWDRIVATIALLVTVLLVVRPGIGGSRADLPSLALIGLLDVAASQPAPNVEWLSGSAEEIPLGDASVGLVFMSQVFHHLARRLPPGPPRSIQSSMRT